MYSIWNYHVLFLLEMFIFTTLFGRWPTLLNCTLKRTALFQLCLTLFISTLKYTMLFWRCKFYRWNTQRYFNVDFALSDMVTSYQGKRNVKTMLKCLLGRGRKIFVQRSSRSDRNWLPKELEYCFMYIFRVYIVSANIMLEW